MQSDTLLGRFHQPTLVPVHRLPDTPEKSPIIQHQAPEHHPHPPVLIPVLHTYAVREPEITKPARSVEDAVTDELVQLRGREWSDGVHDGEQVQQRRVVGLPGSAQDGGADDEDVGALREGVGAMRGDDGLAELAHGGEDGG